MAFLDEIKISLKAGDGGDGVVRWRHDKFEPQGGPNGGDGGRGGNVYVRAIRSMRVLDNYRAKREYEAERGEDGSSRSLKGKNGKDLRLDLPIGSKIVNLTTGLSLELIKEDQEIQLLKGGAGGYGNEHFKASTNQSPQEATAGKPGEAGEFSVEVSLIADIGLIGLPNAGKSSLLNALTNAEAKVGDYAFTTIDPNLGDLYGYTIADIPGLIEGASEGRGLGDKFLRHITRTKVLLHLVSLENANPMKAYETIRGELNAYGNGLTEKPEIIILTKTDTVSEEVVEAMKKKFLKVNEQIFAITLFDEGRVKELGDALVKLLKQK